ncbi:aegerolysin type hemolysin [Jackrogersella minutella]|nr:aegerolysin type hemolysin [Jackrogersella minutella]
MGYAQGKWYKWDNKDEEVSTADIEGKPIKSESKAEIACCGRENSPSGCEASFELFDDHNVSVCRIYFSCTYGNQKNIFSIPYINKGYVVQFEGASLDPGAIGDVTIKVLDILK